MADLEEKSNVGMKEDRKDDYKKYESVFDKPMGMKDPILSEVIAREGTKISRPRVDKSKEEQRERV